MNKDLEELELEMASGKDLQENKEVLQEDWRKLQTKEDNRRRDGWNPANKDGSRTGKKEESKAMVTVDGESVDWTTHSENNEDYAFMASNSSGSDTQAYTQALKKVEAQLVAHQQGQLWYEQKIKFMKIDLDDKTDVLTYHKKLLAKAQKEKDDLEGTMHTLLADIKTLMVALLPLEVVHDYIPVKGKIKKLAQKIKIGAGDFEKEVKLNKTVFELPIWHSYFFHMKGGAEKEEQVFLDVNERHSKQEKKLMGS
ncbi:hypothetical protein Tco_0816772 [Tanacetum coccineum]